MSQNRHSEPRHADYAFRPFSESVKKLGASEEAHSFIARIAGPVEGQFKASHLTPEFHAYFRTPNLTGDVAAAALEKMRSSPDLDTGSTLRLSFTSWKDGAERWFVFKPIDGRVEDSAYDIFQLFGFPAPRRLATREFLLLEWIRHEDMSYFDILSDESLREQLGRAAAVCALIGNHDLQPEQLLVGGEKLHVIDFEASFRANQPLESTLVLALRECLFWSLLQPARKEAEPMFHNDASLARNIREFAEAAGTVFDAVATDPKLRKRLRWRIRETEGLYARVVYFNSMAWKQIPELEKRNLVPHFSAPITPEDVRKLEDDINKVAELGPGWPARIRKLFEDSFLALTLAELMRDTGRLITGLRDPEKFREQLSIFACTFSKKELARELDGLHSVLKDLGLSASREEVESLAISAISIAHKEDPVVIAGWLLSQETQEKFPFLKPFFEQRRRIYALMEKEDISELEAAKRLSLPPHGA